MYDIVDNGSCHYLIQKDESDEMWTFVSTIQGLTDSAAIGMKNALNSGNPLGVRDSKVPGDGARIADGLDQVAEEKPSANPYPPISPPKSRLHDFGSVKEAFSKNPFGLTTPDVEPTVEEKHSEQFD